MTKKKALVQVYTGNGKGKTTAAIGLAVRAAGAGLNVYILQFIKAKPYSEVKAIKKIKNIKVEQCGRGCFIKNKPSKKDIDCARRAFSRARDIITSQKYDIVVLDEINIATHLGLLDTKAVTALIKAKPPSVELVLTGRHCSPAILKSADLVTVMREVKHPYKKGVMARLGIEY